jgi:hypothetical protein
MFEEFNYLLWYVRPPRRVHPNFLSRRIQSIWALAFAAKVLWCCLLFFPSPKPTKIKGVHSQMSLLVFLLFFALCNSPLKIAQAGIIFFFFFFFGDVFQVSNINMT